MSLYWEFENGNKYSKELYSYDDAERASKTLFNCENCIDCLKCENCKDCYNCEFCYDCVNCENCYFCQECFECKNCNSWQKCEFCYDCVYCVECLECYSKSHPYDDIFLEAKYKFYKSRV